MTQSWKAWEPGDLVSNIRRNMDIPSKEEKEFAFLYLFILFGPSTNWRMGIHVGKGISFTYSTDSNAN